MRSVAPWLLLVVILPMRVAAQQPGDSTTTRDAARPASHCGAAAFVLGGGAGLVAGALIGMEVQRVFFPGSGGDDPGLAGFVYGAAAGAIGGVLVGRHFCRRPSNGQVRSQLRMQLMSGGSGSSWQPSIMLRSHAASSHQLGGTDTSLSPWTQGIKQPR